jgi:hypothetical protein
MAEEKKDKKEAKPAGWNLTWDEWIIVLIFLTALIGGVVPMIFSYIKSGEITFFGIPLKSTLRLFSNLLPLFKFFGFMLAGAFGIGTFILNKKADLIWDTVKSKVYPENMTFGVATPTEFKNPVTDKWKQIVEWVESPNEANWRLAIIEADIMLDNLVASLHLPGDTMGERMKAIEKSDFNTIDDAWEAHKARNNIAHQGGGFALNQREARRIISLYERVFREFQLI